MSKLTEGSDWAILGVCERRLVAVGASRARLRVIHLRVGAIVPQFAVYTEVLSLLELIRPRLAASLGTSTASHAKYFGLHSVEARLRCELSRMGRAKTTIVTFLTGSTHASCGQDRNQILQEVVDVGSILVRSTVTVHTAFTLDAV